MPLLSYILAHNEPTLMTTTCTHALDCLFLHAVQNKQGGYECYHIPTHQLSHDLASPSFLHPLQIIVTIDAISKSDGIQNLKITDLHGHLLFDLSVDPALLAGVDDAVHEDDDDTFIAGVHEQDAVRLRI